jgi:hypothetical protein
MANVCGPHTLDLIAVCEEEGSDMSQVIQAPGTHEQWQRMKEKLREIREQHKEELARIEAEYLEEIGRAEAEYEAALLRGDEEDEDDEGA